MDTEPADPSLSDDKLRQVVRTYSNRRKSNLGKAEVVPESFGLPDVPIFHAEDDGPVPDASAANVVIPQLQE